MTAAEIIAELGELIDNRLAVDIIAARHGCTYTDICLAIGKTREFRDFCNLHQRQDPGKKPPTLQDIGMSKMYADGKTVREIAASAEMNEQTVYKRLAKCGAIANKRGRGLIENIYNLPGQMRINETTDRNSQLHIGIKGAR